MVDSAGKEVTISSTEVQRSAQELAGLREDLWGEKRLLQDLTK